MMHGVLAQKNNHLARSDWKRINVAVMREVVLAKFKGNKKLKKLLLATQDAYLVEHTSRDVFWGDGGNGKGMNMLGCILMDVRVQLGGKRWKVATLPKAYDEFLKGGKKKK